LLLFSHKNNGDVSIYIQLRHSQAIDRVFSQRLKNRKWQNCGFLIML